MFEMERFPNSLSKAMETSALNEKGANKNIFPYLERIILTFK